MCGGDVPAPATTASKSEGIPKINGCANFKWSLQKLNHTFRCIGTWDFKSEFISRLVNYWLVSFVDGECFWCLWAFWLEVGTSPFFCSPLKTPQSMEIPLPAQVIQLTQPQKAWFSTRKLGHGGDIPRWRPCDFSWIWVAGKVKESVPAVAADPVVPASADRDALSEIFVKMCFSYKWTWLFHLENLKV